MYGVKTKKIFLEFLYFLFFMCISRNIDGECVYKKCL